MQIRVTSAALILLLTSLVLSCKPAKDNKEAILINELKGLQTLDRKTILTAFHSSDLSTFKINIKDKCKLLDIDINSFYTSNPIEKLLALSTQTIKIDMNGQYNSLKSLLKYLINHKKHIGVSELILDSKQTGYHRMYLSIEIITKDYVDREYLPKAVKAVLGLSVDNLDYLKAGIKVYKARHYFVKRIISKKSLRWESILLSFKLMPKGAFIQKLHYFKTLSNEQLKLNVILGTEDDSLEKCNLFFRKNLQTTIFKKFSKKEKPTPISGTKTASTIYLYQK